MRGGSLQPRKHLCRLSRHREPEPAAERALPISSESSDAAVKVCASLYVVSFKTEERAAGKGCVHRTTLNSDDCLHCP